jgi:DNA polymerase III subunit epsilon
MSSSSLSSATTAVTSQPAKQEDPLHKDMQAIANSIVNLALNDELHHLYKGPIIIGNCSRNAQLPFNVVSVNNLKYTPLYYLMNPNQGEPIYPSDHNNPTKTTEYFNTHMNSDLYEANVINQTDKGLVVDEECFIIDLETTDLNVSTCGIVSLCVILIGPKGQRTDYYWPKINPQIPISIEASKIHGLSNNDVDNCLTFKDVAPKLFEITNNKRPIGYNIDRFDIPIVKRLMFQTLHKFPCWLESIDLYQINILLNPKNLNAMHMQYCHQDLSEAGVLHNARADCLAVHNILHNINQQHPYFPTKIVDIAQWQRSKGKPQYSSQCMQSKGLPIERDYPNKRQKRSIEDYFNT